MKTTIILAVFVMCLAIIELQIIVLAHAQRGSLDMHKKNIETWSSQIKLDDSFTKLITANDN